MSFEAAVNNGKKAPFGHELMKRKKNFLIIGHARHGKDTAAEFMKEIYGYTFESSSVAASRLFIFDVLKHKYGYKSPEECFEDRVNHRDEWYNLICYYNADDKARLAKSILQTSNIYVGMRSDDECQSCVEQGIFDLVIGIFNPDKSLEHKGSFNINIWERSDIIIPNAGSFDDLRNRIINLRQILT